MSYTKFMIDSMIYDKLLADPVTSEKLQRLIGHGAITLLSTHLQLDQLEATRDPERRSLLLSVHKYIPTQLVATHGNQLGLSKFGAATLGGGEAEGVRFEHIVKGNQKDIPDALIGETAAAHVDVLVTGDKRFERRVRSQDTKLQVWGYERLKHFIQAQPPFSPAEST